MQPAHLVLSHHLARALAATMAAYTVETLTIGQIYGGTGGPGGAGGEEGGQGGTGQGNTFTVNAQNAVFNNPGVGVQNAVQAAILDWFSPLNFNPRHQTISQTRAQDTGNWLLVHPQFKAWKESQGAWLWCKGDPGVGKTFLA
ncbi:ANK-REP-REGION domain-containing protein [Mycena chlorophos]|uniref:ANK-REP-REGION domain-containing protein n=1 Tax=Mycena chlorophos TaxID=658473 RepID=A0A8H6W748_MYCCL|nr:ANK-REP-REGION domain-containing protein [Mycena chlorophos]